MKERGVGIFGDTGMVGKTIEYFLGMHEDVKVIFRRNSTRAIGELNECELCFLATSDAESMEFAIQALHAGIRVIDMSGAFRLPRHDFEKWYGIEHTAPALIESAAYGMPAINADSIRGSALVANPGCYATCAILTLRPLKGMTEGEATIVATSGNSGARRATESEPNEITYSYGKRHKHVPEIIKYSGFDVNFTPIVLRSVFRGINMNIRVKLSENYAGLSDEDVIVSLEERIESSYCPDDLVFVRRDASEKMWGDKDVNNTNNMIIKVRAEAGFAYICSMLDNLVKGAAGQAIENMNLMLGLPRLKGLNANAG
ncbi:MAG: hypothetical protein FWH55_08850 [Oscillospiraceae bacterium]|nr:hypothetical protein [Oscillospiraceae bacterium]